MITDEKGALIAQLRQSGFTVIHVDDLSKIADDAAKKAVEALGISPEDVQTVKEFSENYRNIKRGAFQRLGQYLMMILMGLTILAAGNSGWFKNVKLWFS